MSEAEAIKSRKTLGQYAKLQLAILVAFLLLTTLPTYFLLMRPNALAKQYDAAFSQIEKGMSEAGVLKLMGQPERIDVPPTSLTWEADPLDANTAARVKREYHYSTGSFFLPTFWTVGFDEQRTVVAKHRSG